MNGDTFYSMMRNMYAVFNRPVPPDSSPFIMSVWERVQHIPDEAVRTSWLRSRMRSGCPRTWAGRSCGPGRAGRRTTPSGWRMTAARSAATRAFSGAGSGTGRGGIGTFFPRVPPAAGPNIPCRRRGNSRSAGSWSCRQGTREGRCCSTAMPGSAPSGRRTRGRGREDGWLRMCGAGGVRTPGASGSEAERIDAAGKRAQSRKRG